MTREEALQILDTIPTIGEQVDALEMAIKALEQEPCEDCISRADVIDLCDSKDSEYKVAHFKEDVECLPSVTPKPKTDVLDKIRAEIMDFEEELFHRPNTDYTDYAAVRHCVEIIDKYKAESEDMSEVGVEILKAEETKESGIKYLNINVSNSEVERNPDIVRLCADAGILEYVCEKKS